MRLNISFMISCMIAILASGLPAPAEQPTPEPTPVPTPVIPEIDVDSLIYDPIGEKPEIASVAAIRTELARSDSGVADFEAAAEKLVNVRAWYSALGLLWWAEKMDNDPDVRERLNASMLECLKHDRETDDDVDMAMQLEAAGRPDRALQNLIEIRTREPLNAQTHYYIGKLQFGGFLTEQDRATTAGLDTGLRARLFRICYCEYNYALAIDPLYMDARDGLSTLRMVFSDHPEFLVRTNILTERAADFRSDAAPVIGRIENGDRSPQTLAEAGDGLMKGGVADYAIFAWRAALIQGGPDWDQAGAVQKKIDDARAKL